MANQRRKILFRCPTNQKGEDTFVKDVSLGYETGDAVVVVRKTRSVVRASKAEQRTEEGICHTA